MPKFDHSRSENNLESENQHDNEVGEKSIVESMTLKSPNTLKERIDKPKNSKPEEQISNVSIPNAEIIERALRHKAFLVRYQKDLENLEKSYNLKAESGMETGIFSSKPRNNFINNEDNLYYFKHMVPAGKPSQQPISDLLKDMLMQATKQTGIYAPDMIRKVPYPEEMGLFEKAKANMVKYINHKVSNGTEIWKPKITGMLFRFGSKFTSRTVIPKISSVMKTRFGKLLLKFMRK